MAGSDQLGAVLDALGYASTEGLVLERQIPEVTARSFVWRELREKGGAEGAYFNGGVPLVAFAQAEGPDEAYGIHRRLWNLGRVPLLITAGETTTAAYSCFVGPDAPDQPNPALLKSAPSGSVTEDLADFSRFSVETGRAATRFESYFGRSGRVDRRLLENLRTLRRRLGATGERQRVLDAVIGRAIFIRYFEDRRILTSEHLRELTPYASFLEVLDAGVEPTYGLFASLGARFNGDVFPPSQFERALVTSADLETISSFLGGTDPNTGQQSFWPYDFSIIPPELISSIYEQLLEEQRDEDAAFYTPRSVVDLILDEVLPWSSDAPTPRVLDPSCGSGIFLTEAFRRITYRQLIKNGRDLRFEELSQLLTASMFGIDKSPAAISVTAMGLYLAMLENVDPPSAWRDAALPILLGRNLLAADFFGNHALTDATFDVVVGNPPWKSALSPAAASHLETNEIKVPDKQIALAFLFAAKRHLTPTGIVGLLLPAKALLHNKSPTSLRSRQRMFREYSIETIVDLSILRRGTFESAVAPAAVLVARRHRDQDASAPDRDAEIVHVVPRTSPLQASLESFFVSQADVHRIRQTIAQESPDLWKLLVWGSMRDFGLVSRLRREHPTVSAVAMRRNWIHGRGYQITGGDANDSSHLVGRATVPVDAVRPFRLAAGRRGRIQATTMHRPRDPRLFEGPLVLFRRGLLGGLPAVAFSSRDVAFTDSVFGVSAPKADKTLLRLLVAYANSSLGHYYQFLTSSSWGVERDYIDGNEYLSMPFAMASGKERADVIAALDPLEKEGFEGSSAKRLNSAVYRAYGLIHDEIEQLEDTLALGLDQFRSGVDARSFRPPSQPAVRSYRSRMKEALAAPLASLNIEVWVTAGIDLYRVATVGLSPRGLGDDLGDPGPKVLRYLRSIVTEEASRVPSPVTVFQPSILVMDGSYVHLVKPDEARYWTRSAGREDGAELLAAVLSSSVAHGAE